MSAAGAGSLTPMLLLTAAMVAETTTSVRARLAVPARLGLPGGGPTTFVGVLG